MPRATPFLLLLGLGLLMGHASLWISGFGALESGPGDPQFNLYVLEHVYRWLTGDPAHASLWSPPIFHPQPGVLAWSETYLALGPLYWPWRLLGFAPDTSFQIWLPLLSVLNFSVAYRLFRGPFGFGSWGSALGAFFFSFGAPRIAQLGHQQLLPQFFSLGAVYAAARFLEAGRARARWPYVFAACAAAQFYSGVYYFWFLAFLLGIAAVWALAYPDTRRILLGAAKRNAPHLACAAVLACALLAPLVSRYLEASRLHGFRQYREVETMLPTLQSWFYLGPSSWLYGWQTLFKGFRIISMEHEQRIGIGILTACLALAGLWGRRREPLTRILLLTTFTVAALATVFPGGHSLWRHVYDLIPGARAIRAVARIALPLLLPAAYGIASFAEGPLARFVRTRRAPVWAAALLLAFAMAEQGQTNPSRDKRGERERIGGIAAQVKPGCSSFVFMPGDGPGQDERLSWMSHTDAMLAQLEAGVPSVNGYSGGEPPGWGLAHVNVRGEDDRRRIETALAAWAKRWGIEPKGICRVGAYRGRG